MFWFFDCSDFGMQFFRFGFFVMAFAFAFDPSLGSFFAVSCVTDCVVSIGPQRRFVFWAENRTQMTFVSKSRFSARESVMGVTGVTVDKNVKNEKVKNVTWLGWRRFRFTVLIRMRMNGCGAEGRKLFKEFFETFP